MQPRKKPTLPSRTPRRPGETGPRTVSVPRGPKEVPPAPGTRRDCPIVLGRGRSNIPMNGRYRPAMKRPRSVSTSEDSNDGNDEIVANAVTDANEGNNASFDSHESMESADERDSDSDNDAGSTDATKENDDSPESDGEEADARAADVTTPEQSDDDGSDSEVAAKLPVKQPSGIPEGIKSVLMTTGEREAILRKELCIPPPTPKNDTTKKIVKLGRARQRPVVNIKGNVDNPIYYNYEYKNHLTRPDDTVYYRYILTKPVAGTTSSGGPSTARGKVNPKVTQAEVVKKNENKNQKKDPKQESGQKQEPKRESQIPKKESQIPKKESQIPRKEPQIPNKEPQIPKKESQIPKKEPGLTLEQKSKSNTEKAPKQKLAAKPEKAGE